MAAAPGIGDGSAGPPPVLTRRGADILVRVEKMLDEAARIAAQAPAPREGASNAAGATDDVASATQSSTTGSAKN
jgi:penicillin-binding protein 1A